MRVGLWAGSPLPLFHPDRRDVRGVRHALTFGTKIQVAADANERPLHCHHEKIVVIDDCVAFVGGIDLTTFAGDRYDTYGHEARGSVGWHDAATVLRGPNVADVAEHFRGWQSVTAEPLPPPRRPPCASAVQAQLVRTVPERLYQGVCGGDFSILEAYMRGPPLGAGADLPGEPVLVVERDRRDPAGKARTPHPPTDDFRLVLLLPARPNDGADDARGQLGDLIE